MSITLGYQQYNTLCLSLSFLKMLALPDYSPPSDTVVVLCIVLVQALVHHRAHLPHNLRLQRGNREGNNLSNMRQRFLHLHFSKEDNHKNQMRTTKSISQNIFKILHIMPISVSSIQLVVVVAAAVALVYYYYHHNHYYTIITIIIIIIIIIIYNG